MTRIDYRFKNIVLMIIEQQIHSLLLFTFQHTVDSYYDNYELNN